MQPATTPIKSSLPTSSSAMPSVVPLMPVQILAPSLTQHAHTHNHQYNIFICTPPNNKKQAKHFSPARNNVAAATKQAAATAFSPLPRHPHPPQRQRRVHRISHRTPNQPFSPARRLDFHHQKELERKYEKMEFDRKIAKLERELKESNEENRLYENYLISAAEKVHALAKIFESSKNKLKGPLASETAYQYQDKSLRARNNIVLDAVYIKAQIEWRESQLQHLAKGIKVDEILIAQSKKEESETLSPISSPYKASPVRPQPTSLPYQERSLLSDLDESKKTKKKLLHKLNNAAKRIGSLVHSIDRSKYRLGCGGGYEATKNLKNVDDALKHLLRIEFDVIHLTSEHGWSERNFEKVFAHKTTSLPTTSRIHSNNESDHKHSTAAAATQTKASTTPSTPQIVDAATFKTPVKKIAKQSIAVQTSPYALPVPSPKPISRNRSPLKPINLQKTPQRNHLQPLTSPQKAVGKENLSPNDKKSFEAQKLKIATLEAQLAAKEKRIKESEAIKEKLSKVEDDLAETKRQSEAKIREVEVSWNIDRESLSYQERVNKELSELLTKLRSEHGLLE